ncbi:MAG: sugar ABC transporter permease [Lachnospiraceae bacterium]|nr:ABC transporter permease subunit [uncultured Acetatifactor sp.]MCI9230636.1 sugar ABC transporter permease [Lachnospiraceae bacterium]MCI9571399.1 sugar ABC transporter permease [Lachnospiraceae bacterium]
MAIPGLAYLVVNNYLPMFGLVIAFKKLDFRLGIWDSPWAGLQNFSFLFRTKDAFIITRNTILYNAAFIVVGTVLAIAIAILLNEIRSRLASRLYQSILLIPYLMSWVVVGYLAFAFLSSDTGYLNKALLRPLGLQEVSWYMEKKYWPFILILVNQWKNIGFTMVVYLASIVGINKEYFEAARIDGAGKWKQVRYITLPLLKPTVITLTLLNIGRIFYSDFGLFYQVPRNSGMLYDVTRTIDVYVYNALMKNTDYAMASAASFYQSVVGFVLIIGANLVIRKVNRENALF